MFPTALGVFFRPLGISCLSKQPRLSLSSFANLTPERGRASASDAAISHSLSYPAAESQSAADLLLNLCSPSLLMLLISSTTFGDIFRIFLEVLLPDSSQAGNLVSLTFFT